MDTNITYSARVKLEEKLDMWDFLKEFGLGPRWLSMGFVTTSIITQDPRTNRFTEAYIMFKPGKSNEILVRSRDWSDPGANAVVQGLREYLDYKGVNYELERPVNGKLRRLSLHSI